jgi:hypothetical protein
MKSEMEKWNCNVECGIIGMKRNVNLKLVKFLHTYDDVREVRFNFFHFLLPINSCFVCVHHFLSGELIF